MYQVLARKWRPQNFQELVGQNHVVKALENSLLQKRLHHAYLLTGTRGVGKTTIARILAKCLNCLAYDDVTSEPCGKCTVCCEIEQGNFPDLIEVDAASKTKVEDTRDLLDNVQYLPVIGRYKVYLIDEVHMLSGHSFNALLKTLEEPPQHVKFVLATTDPQKIPVTILSRCLQFSLKKLSPHFIQQQLSKILLHEKIHYEESALYRLALMSDGSMRDALSLLDQAIAYGNGEVTSSDVTEMLGIIDKSYIWQLLEYLCNQDGSAILSLIDELESLAKDFTSVIEELLQCLHQLTIIKIIPSYDKFIFDNQEKLQELAKKFSAEEIQLYYQMALIGKRDLFLAPSNKTGFEMLMLRMLAFRPLNIMQLTEHRNNNHNTHTQNIIYKNNITQNNTEKNIAKKDIVKSQTLTQDEKKQNISLSNDINMLLQQINFTGMAYELMKNCVIAKIEENKIVFNLTQNCKSLLTNALQERITNTLIQASGRKLHVDFQIVDNNTITTPAIVKQNQIKQEQESKLQTVLNNQDIQNIINTFDAELVNFDVKKLE